MIIAGAIAYLAVASAFFTFSTKEKCEEHDSYHYPMMMFFSLIWPIALLVGIVTVKQA